MFQYLNYTHMYICAKLFLLESMNSWMKVVQFYKNAREKQTARYQNIGKVELINPQNIAPTQMA